MGISATATACQMPCASQNPSTSGGGGDAASPALAEAIASLAAAVSQLSAAVNALAGNAALGTPPPVAGGGGGEMLPQALPEAPPIDVAPAAAAAETKPKPSGKEQLIIPVDGARVTSKFGEVASIRGGVPHTGTDYAVPMGTSVKAAAGGTIAEVGSDDIGGKWIVVDHGDGMRTYYGHLSSQDIKEGASVKQGDHIGKVGTTGLSTGPHLHFGLFKGTDRNKNVEDPEAFMKRGGTV